ncbi:MAG TPA: hypothetical protein VFB37_13940 [Steroidobacteraceae bacterium]|nr:hypothetical protein [Steroidobacteraceae bacterium]
MGSVKAACAAVAAAALISMASGCASTDEPGVQHGHLVQPPTTEGPFCGAQHPFGEIKGGEVERAVTLKSAEPMAIAADDHPSDAGKLLVLNHPLDPLPPEVARIRRGIVKRFTGKFIRDGQMSWSGLDLERLVAVSVERRVFDLRAHQSREVPDPVFTQTAQLSFARKWTDGQRTEVEVVEVFPITLVEAQFFVCAANPLWADKKPLPEVEDVSGDLSDGTTDVFLLDRRQQQDVTYRYTKTVYMSPNLAAVLDGIWQHAPKGPTW